MSETYEIPEAVTEVIREGMPALKAFRQFDGRTSHDVAVAAGIGPILVAILESGRLAASAAEFYALAAVFMVPGDQLFDE